MRLTSHNWIVYIFSYLSVYQYIQFRKINMDIHAFLRKPRLNAELVAAQVAQVMPPKVKKAERKDRDRKGDSRNLQKGR